MDFTSSFSDRLNTNYCPSEKEISEIKSLIAAKQSIVEDIDRQIEALAERRAKYSDFIKEHSALLSPFRRSPTDVLSSIFSACLPPPNGVKNSKIHPAIAISHVCKQWRHLAIAQPLLWCHFEVFHPILPRPRFAGYSNRFTPAALAIYRSDLAIYRSELDRAKDMLLAWISRSANCPITFTLKSQDIPPLAYHGHSSTPPSANEAIVDILCDVSARWKCALFDLWISTPTSPLLKFSQLSPQDVPQLERVRHRVGFSSDMNWDESRILERRMIGIGLFGGPSIRKLVIDRLSPSLDSMSVNWATVTDLELDDSHRILARTGRAIELITSVLKVCHQLTRLAVNIIGGWQSESTVSDIILPIAARIPLPYLTSVSIRGEATPSGFASSLQLPMLHTLSLLCEADEHTEAGLVEWMTTFGEALTDVTLLFTGLTENALNHCLEHLPNATTLRLLESHRPRYWPASNDAVTLNADSEIDPSSHISILQKLTPRVNDYEPELQCYCPKLQKFAFRMQDVVFNEEDLVEFVAARRKLPLPSSSRLKTVVVKFSFRQQMDLREELHRQDVDMEDFRLITKYNTMDQAYMGSSNSFISRFEELGDLPVEDQIVVTDVWLHGNLTL